MGIGFGEFALVVVAGLVVLGPERLVETVRIGRRLYRMLHRQFSELQAQVRVELQEEQVQHREERQQAVRSALKLSSDPPETSHSTEASGSVPGHAQDLPDTNLNTSLTETLPNDGLAAEVVEETPPCDASDTPPTSPAEEDSKPGPA